MGISYSEKSNIFHIYTKNTSYQILLYQNTYPMHMYWGQRLYGEVPSSQLEVAYYRRSELMNLSPDAPMFSREFFPFEYPCYGTSDFRSPGYEIVDSNRNRITDARYVSHKVIDGKPDIPSLPSSYCQDSDNAQTLVITLLDSLLNLQIDLYYTAFENRDVITRHVEFKNLSSETIHLTRALSFSMDLKHGPKQMLQLCGTALRETHVERRDIGTGMTGFESRRGISSHEHNPFVALVNPDTTETTGEVYAASLVYSGNFTIQAERDMHGSVRFQAGINPFGFDWCLIPDASFATPEVLLVHSSNGLEQMSLTYHRFMRDCIARGTFAHRPRPVLLNTWEASYFNFTHDSVMELARAAAKTGVELLVLDDGWFGHRDDDHSSLGDWYPDLQKLPKGIEGLCQDINSLGLQMGLWFEPEMISPDSDLYRAHPDWCLHVPDRKRSECRFQLMLDLSRADVCDYIVQSISKVLGSCNIQYVKWDCNRRITEAGSALLSDEQSGEIFHRYVLGLYSILDRIMGRFPNILFENCASGGSRFDPAMMCYFSQNWTSDNTDAISRLKIQHGASMVYPPIWCTSHVSASPNHQLERASTLSFREHVCQPFNLGYELNLLQMSEEERAEIVAQIQRYKQIRPYVQFGDFYRLMSPFDGNDTAWMVCAEDAKQILVWYYKPYAQASEAYISVQLRHLEEQAMYRLVGTDEVFSGSILMHVGLTLDWKNGDHFSQFWHFEKVD